MEENYIVIPALEPGPGLTEQIVELHSRITAQIIVIDDGSGEAYRDIFDRITTQMKWLAHLGDAGYTFLLWFNGWYNRYRAWRGKPYDSFSQRIKQKVKSAVSYISDFEQTLTDFAAARKCDGIICGHIHHPENRYYGKVHYLNSGDWVETLSALVENENGEWNVIYYTKIANDELQAKLTSNILSAS